MTMKKKNSSVLHKCRLLANSPTLEVCHHPGPSSASHAPDTRTTAKAARVRPPPTRERQHDREDEDRKHQRDHREVGDRDQQPSPVDGVGGMIQMDERADHRSYRLTCDLASHTHLPWQVPHGITPWPQRGLG
jgi:hypothetical protein